MPHAELKYSPDLEIDAPALLARIEAVISAMDSGAGDCKGRAYPAAHAHHSHLIAEVSLLPKAHRDAAFMELLRNNLKEALVDALPRPCWMTLNVTFSGPDYVTEFLE